MNFEEFKSYVKKDMDISRFEKRFSVMLDLNGAVPRETIGFHFSVNTEEQRAETKDLFETFAPTAIWCGNEKVLAAIAEMGYRGKLFPWFQGSGYAVVLKIPVYPLKVAEKKNQEQEQGD